ncbi:spore cortex biosynthesis protein YabQ [Carboxydothermus islandicus]|uniref:spore cortex biosynthesis protein YabQ n=1 Tax=Carboxydothermus islandicus TaxID=661089 RepID=UPI00096A6E72|nr:spore cortex biosynthesis protein YabQ [Carboxydothermus islandicus]
MGAPISLTGQIREVILFLLAVVLGFFLCGLYFLENFILRRKYGRKKKLFPYFVADILYFTVIGGLILGYFLFFNQGEVRGYGFLGIITGIVLYYFILNKNTSSKGKT